MALRADRSCRSVRRLLSGALDGEVIAPRRAASVASHLMKCSGCRDFDARTVTLTRHLRISALEPVPDLSDRILAGIGVVSTSQGLEVVDRTPAHSLSVLRVGSTPGLMRWSAAVLVLAVGLSSLASGAMGHTHIVPSHPVTPCTASLAHRHM